MLLCRQYTANAKINLLNYFQSEKTDVQLCTKNTYKNKTPG